LAIQKIKPDLILSSSSLRTQNTVNILVENIQFKGKVHYMSEIYMVRPEIIMDTISLQDDKYDDIFLVGHNPELTEIINSLIDDNFHKLPTMGVISIKLDINSWNDIKDTKGDVDFFISPKQFKYYVPKQIRTTLDRVDN
jgi:phosphohistidine phosphatase